MRTTKKGKETEFDERIARREVIIAEAIRTYIGLPIIIICTFVILINKAVKLYDQEIMIIMRVVSYILY